MEETSAYLREVIVYDHVILQEMDEKHRGRYDLQPFVEPEIGKLLSLLVRTHEAHRVLELGTGIGYSTIWMAAALRETGGSIITIDNHARTNKEARGFFKEAGLQAVITSIEAFIEKIIPSMAEEQPACFDMIFQDGGKHLYPLMYEHLYTLLTPGGILVTDDVLFPAEQEIRDGLKAPVDAYNMHLKNDCRYYTSVIPVGHGVSISLKIG